MASLSQSTLYGRPKFVTQLSDKYLCPVCKDILQDAVQTSCGHRICEGCVETLFQGQSLGAKVRCPYGEPDCDMLAKSDINLDPAFRREIRNLQVHCDNKEFGCNQKMKWHSLEKHMSDCQFKPVDCPNNDRGCNVKLSQSKVKEHLQDCDFRTVECRHCKTSLTANELMDHVELSCEAVERDCPFKCGTSPMKRKQLQDHIKTCDNKPMQCPFSGINCEFAGSSKQVIVHLSSAVQKHLNLTLTYVRNSEDKHSKNLETIEELISDNQSLNRKVGEMVSKNEQLSNQLKDTKLKMVSLTERVIHLEKLSEGMGRKEAVDAHDREIRSINTTLAQLRTQTEALERTANNLTSGGVTTGASAEVTRKLNIHDSQFANFDIQMAELDLRFQILETASFDGTLLWKVRDYRRRKQDAVAGRTLSLYSQPFYTHRYGYKMCARVYLNGDGMGKGSHLSLFFVVMRGEYDNLLAWPFQQKVTMILLDQETGQSHLSDSFKPDPTSSSFKKPTTDMNIASGCPLFVSHSVLESPKYVRDDVIMLKFIVDLTNPELIHP